MVEFKENHGGVLVQNLVTIGATNVMSTDGTLIPAEDNLAVHQHPFWSHIASYVPKSISLEDPSAEPVEAEPDDDLDSLTVLALMSVCVLTRHSVIRRYRSAARQRRRPSHARGGVVVRTATDNATPARSRSTSQAGAVLRPRETRSGATAATSSSAVVTTSGPTSQGIADGLVTVLSSRQHPLLNPSRRTTVLLVNPHPPTSGHPSSRRPQEKSQANNSGATCLSSQRRNGMRNRRDGRCLRQ